MAEEQLRKELYAANENRGIIYALLYDELKKELGKEKAASLMKRAIYRRGEMLAEKFKPFAPHDLQGLCQAFVSGVADDGQMFRPEVRSCTKEKVEVEFSACPLKKAWQDMGLSDEECAELCDIAGIIDAGMFEGAGFSFNVQALPQGRKDSCLLTISKK